jgi:hypothetical protein
MRHIKEFVLFEEQDEWNKEALKKIQEDPEIKNWLDSFKLKHPLDFYGEYGNPWTVVTPSGEEVDVHFFDDHEYTGEGDWDVTSDALDFGGVRMKIKGRARGYHHDDLEETEFDPDMEAGFIFSSFDPAVFAKDNLIKYPEIVYMFYTLLPDHKKKEVDEVINWSEIDIKSLKRGSSILSKFKK